MGFLLVPVADIRPLSLLPLYPLDFVLLTLILGTTVCWNYKNFSKRVFSVTGFVFGLFLLSSVLSWLVNGASATGLGQLKSWILLPGIAALFVALTLQSQKNRDDSLLKIWFIALLSLLAILLPYQFFQLTTFDGRLQGPFTSPNFLAFFLFPGIILCYYFWQQTNERRKKSLFLVAGLLFTYALFCTHSFGAFLATLSVFLWHILQRKNTYQHLKKIALVGVLAAFLIGGELFTNDKLQAIAEERSSLSSRLTIWEVSLKAIADNPIFGIGVGRFQEVYLSYQPLFPPYLEWAVPQPHNLILALWLQTGLVGLAVSIWLFSKVFAPRRETAEAYKILQALFVGMLVYGIFDTPLFGNALAFLWWTVFWFLAWPPKVGQEEI